MNPRERPTCDELLNIPLMRKVASKLKMSANVSKTIPTKAELMKTIKLPSNL